MRIARRVVLIGILSIVAIAGAGLAVLFVEGAVRPDRSGEYVALGSSFAAGPKLGPLAPDSPHACWRTADNYAHRLARVTGLRLVDVSCGGATAKNLSEGGPFFQPPQVEAVGSSARLVTITVGGNDVAISAISACWSTEAAAAFWERWSAPCGAARVRSMRDHSMNSPRG